MWGRISGAEGLNMNIYNFMNQQMTAGKKGKATVKKLNKSSEIDLLMKKVYLN